ncbi:MAG: leucyl/phenylalanyl-tRNA--protein transferase [Planctomycetes bacterium]|nr:leucyl/phenylalanyl-tRNA--protein transferase [Planctomycetota bacterium]
MTIPYIAPGSPPAFPDPVAATDDLVAVGADLEPERVLFGYELGIFPWYGEDELPLWWCPDPRAVLLSNDLHVSRSMKRVLARHDFSLTWNRCFERVMRECSRDRPDGMWIHDDMVASYLELHRRGHAHSLEVWSGERLVGGIYGVQCGSLFAAESKFHRVTDMSKVALIALVRTLERAGIELIDVQLMTPHLASLGVTEWPRTRYLAHLDRVKSIRVDLSSLEPSVSP